MKNQNPMAAEIVSTMKAMFDECGERSLRIAQLYTRSRKLGRAEEHLDEQAGIVADIAAEGVKLASAFTGMMMTANLGKLLGVTAEDALAATNGPSVIDADSTEGDQN